MTHLRFRHCRPRCQAHWHRHFRQEGRLDGSPSRSSHLRQDRACVECDCRCLRLALSLNNETYMLPPLVLPPAPE
jgi:hypothetical protein